jgi:hypothetical protein
MPHGAGVVLRYGWLLRRRGLKHLGPNRIFHWNLDEEIRQTVGVQVPGEWVWSSGEARPRRGSRVHPPCGRRESGVLHCGMR